MHSHPVRALTFVPSLTALPLRLAGSLDVSKCSGSRKQR